MSKHLLLTGGLGFVGAHAVAHFLKTTDWDITVLDSMRFSGRIERLTEIEGYDPDRCQVFWHDLRSPIHATLRSAIGDVDYIINAASDSHVDRSITDPVPFIHNNVMLSVNMLEYAREVKPEKYVQVSTDEVFGPAPLGYSHKENDPLLPSNPYSASKGAQELISYSYWRTYNVPLIITNTMNMLGEKQNREKMIPSTIYKVLNGETVTIHARPNPDGSWTPGSRVWLHARNWADAHKFILENLDIVNFGEGEPLKYNVAGEREIDNLELAQTIADILEMPLKYEMVDFHSSRPGHDLRYSLDGSKLAAAGWVPPVPLEESLRQTVLWSRDHPEWLDI